MSVSYLVKLSCGHEYRYSALSHPYKGAVLSCPSCGTTARSVSLSDRREEPECPHCGGKPHPARKSYQS